MLFLFFYSFFWGFDRTNHIDWYVVKETAVKTAQSKVPLMKMVQFMILNKDGMTWVLVDIWILGKITVRLLFVLIPVNSQAQLQMPWVFSVKREKKKKDFKNQEMFSPFPILYCFIIIFERIYMNGYRCFHGKFYLFHTLMYIHSSSYSVSFLGEKNDIHRKMVHFLTSFLVF